jgi:hypothetical protein
MVCVPVLRDTLLFFLLAATPTACFARCTIGTPTCYVDDTTQGRLRRPLGPEGATAPHRPSMTQQGCAQLCFDQHRKLAGIEYGWQCYCGGALNFQPNRSAGCTTPCPGAASQKCGGADAMLVFAFNCSGSPVPVPPPPPPPPPLAVPFDWLDPCNLTAVINFSVGFGWCNYSRPHVERARALVAAMTLEEKARTMQPFAPPIDRLRLPPLWTTDALHGAFSSPHYRNCTVFPQAVANAASFDRE